MIAKKDRKYSEDDDEYDNNEEQKHKIKNEMSTPVTGEKETNSATMRYCSKSNPGFSDGKVKTNQDAVAAYVDSKGNRFAYFAVFDGHGVFGHKVSGLLKALLHDAILSRIDVTKTYNGDEYIEMLTAACLDMNDKLISSSTVNSMLSGSTGIVVLLHNEFIVCGNVGDSRAALVNLKEVEDPGALEMLSRDHTPNEADEKERILQAGGKVMACIDPFGNPIGPPRIWDDSGEGPGLMMSRSFGDQMGHRVGMTARPGILLANLRGQSGHSRAWSPSSPARQRWSLGEGHRKRSGEREPQVAEGERQRGEDLQGADERGNEQVEQRMHVLQR